MELVNYVMVLEGRNEDVKAFTEGTLGGEGLAGEKFASIMAETDHHWPLDSDLIYEGAYDKKTRSQWFFFEAYGDLMGITRIISQRHPVLTVTVYANDCASWNWAAMQEYRNGEMLREYARDYGSFDTSILYLAADIATGVSNGQNAIKRTLKLFRKWAGWDAMECGPGKGKNLHVDEFLETLEEYSEMHLDIIDLTTSLIRSVADAGPMSLSRGEIWLVEALLAYDNMINGEHRYSSEHEPVRAWLELSRLLDSKEVVQKCVSL